MAGRLNANNGQASVPRPGATDMAEQSETPTHRETMQRVQIGLIGLGAVLLVVTFANVIVKTIRPGDTQTLSTSGQAAADAGTTNGTTTEALEDLGVTPKSDQAVGPSVPDLEPDPRLSKPMDQDPKKRGQQR
jgi:hypothetical protein